MKTIILFSLIFLFTYSSVYSQTWEDLNEKSDEYYNLDDLENALKYARLALEKAEIEYGKTNEKYIKSLFNLASLYSQTGSYSAADPLYQEALEIQKEVLGEDNPDYFKLLKKLASFYKSNGRYIQAEPLYKELLAIQKEVFGVDHTEYATSLNNLGLLYYTMGRYSDAEPLYKESFEITKKASGEHDLGYAIILNNLALLYYSTNRYTEAEPLYKESLEITKIASGEHDPGYAISLDNLASLYSKMGRSTEAENLYKEAQEIFKEDLEANQKDYALSLYAHADLYESIGRYTEAETLFVEAIVNFKAAVGVIHPHYAEAITGLAGLYSAMGRYTDAEPLYENTIRIYNELYGERHPQYAAALNKLAGLYKLLGRYAEAESLYQEALEIYKEASSDKRSGYTMTLAGLAVLYEAMGRYTDAEPLYKEVLVINKEIFGERHKNYAIALNNLAGVYRSMGRYSEAEHLYIESIELKKVDLEQSHPDYASALSNLAVLYELMGRYTEAEPLFKESLNGMKALGKNSPGYFQSLMRLAILYNSMGRYNDAEPLFIEGTELCVQQLNTTYSSMSEKEKYKFLNILSPTFEVFYSFVFDYNGKNNYLVKTFQNLLYSTKGITLNSTANVKNSIMNSGDSNLINLYDKFISKRRELAFIYTLSTFNDIMLSSKLDRLEVETNELEKEFNLKSEIFKFEFESRDVKWEDVQSKLKTDEAVVDYINFRYLHNKWTDTTYYCALITRPGYESPELIKLCSGKELESLFEISATSEDSYVRNRTVSLEIYNLIWKPIEQYLSGVKTVYISPSGLLSQVSFASLNVSENELLIDRYCIRYLGNIKDILTKLEEPSITGIPNSNAAVFGAADFDLDFASIGKNADDLKKNNKLQHDPDVELSDSLVRELQGQKWIYLRGTEEETAKIIDLFESYSIDAALYTKENASEDILKSLNSKNSPTILHVSTHGFFFPDPEKIFTSLPLDFLRLGSNFEYSENPLLRSGIVLSGANYVWTRNQPIENVEDGIVTAYEISNMDLVNTELVVLSACGTGLGDIRGSEGVFGLQRAFKTAGAKSMIMSLWNVPDKQTMELMNLFYKNWLSGKTKSGSLHEAQLEMRKKYEPYYWAAFVLVE